MIIDKSKIVAKYINNKETLLKIIANSKPNKETNTGFWLFDECIKKDPVYSKINEGPWYIKYIVYLYENKPIALRSFSEDYYTKYESDEKLKEKFKKYVRLFDFQVDSKYAGNHIQQYAWNHLKEIEQKKGFEGFTLMCYEPSLQQKYKKDGFHGDQRFMWKSFNESYNIIRNKKALYESIMRAVAKEVKKALNEEQQKNNLYNKVTKFGKYAAKKPMLGLEFVCGDLEILYNEKYIINNPNTPEKVKSLINFTIPEGYKGCEIPGQQPFQLFMRKYLSNGLDKEFKNNNTDYTYFNKFDLLFSTNTNKIGIAYKRPEGQLIFLNTGFYDFSKGILTNIILLLDQTIDKILKEFDLNSSFMWEFDEKSRILHKNNPTSKYIEL